MEPESFDVNPPPVADQDIGSDSLSCGALAIHPAHPDKIYVGTGEGVFFGYFGVGPASSFRRRAKLVLEGSAGQRSA